MAPGRCARGCWSAKALGFQFSTSDRIHEVHASSCTSTALTLLLYVLCYMITLFFLYSHDPWCSGQQTLGLEGPISNVVFLVVMCPQSGGGLGF